MSRSLEDLIARWEQVAAHAATYELTLDDWLNDLDLRDIISRRIRETPEAYTAPLSARLASADQVFRDGTSEASQSLWGPTAGAEHRATHEWWYFRYPAKPGSSMRRDLQTAGVLRRRDR